MKKIMFLFTLLSVSLGFAQNAPIDFESGGFGASWTWTVFENDTDPAVEIIANPVSGGINTSATVLKFTALTNGANWAGCESQHGSDIGTWTPSASNSYVTMKVYQVGFSSEVALKFANSAGGAIGEVFAPVSAADTWVEVSFDMSDWIGHPESPTDQIIMFPDRSNRTADHIIYLDDITFSSVPAGTCSDGIENGTETGIDCGGTCPNACTTPVPLVSAPLSTTPESDVLWIYSDVYTNPANQSPFINANWAAVPPSSYGTSTEVVIAGTTDNVRYITDIGLLYAPINNTDLSTFNYFHVDIWSTNSTFVIVKWESGNSPEAADMGITLTPNQWTSVDIDLNTWGALANPAARTALRNFILDATGGNDYYLDNIYFSKTAFVLGTEDFAKIAFKVYPNPTENNWTVRTENLNMSSIKVFDVLGKQVLSFSPNTTETIIDGSSLKAGLYFAQIKTETGTNSIKLVRK